MEYSAAFDLCKFILYDSNKKCHLVDSIAPRSLSFKKPHKTVFKTWNWNTRKCLGFLLASHSFEYSKNSRGLQMSNYVKCCSHQLDFPQMCTQQNCHFFLSFPCKINPYSKYIVKQLHFNNLVNICIEGVESAF